MEIRGKSQMPVWVDWHVLVYHIYHDFAQNIKLWERTPEQEMAIHSSILACKIPWKEEPGGL